MGMIYQNGEVLLTRKIKFASLIPDGTDLIFLSSYCLDFDWLRVQLKKTGIAPVWLCLHYDTKAEPAGISEIVLDNGRPLTMVKPRFPPYLTYGIMHAKLSIYRTKEFVRIIISSANLMPHDYDEGPIQNILYVQDFARIIGENNSLEIPAFFTDLSNFLTLLGAKEFVPLIRSFDYSNTEHVRIVYSTPGSHYLGQKCCGIEMLGRSFEHFGAYHYDSTSKDIEITVQGSSLGKMHVEWLSKFYEKLTGRSSNGAPKGLKIVFPTESFAVSYGKEEFGTIFCQSENWYNYSSDVVKMFCKCAAIGPLHTKIVTNGSVNYLGSHNFTPAAWGRYTKALDKLMVNNFELGVVLNRPIPIPFKMPAEPYTNEDRPWMQDLHF